MSTSANVEGRLRQAVDSLPRGLRDHILRVEVESARLAERHGVDVQRAKISALGHDLVRHKSDEELLHLAADYDFSPDEVEQNTPILVHGPVAARILSVDFGMSDGDVLAGVDCHSTARADMAPIEKVLFLADKIEPHKLERSPDWRVVYDLAEDDLDAGLLRFLDLQLEQAVRRSWLVHRRSLEARNQLLILNNGGGLGSE